VLDLLQHADDRTVNISALGPRAATAAMMTAMPQVSTRRVWALEARVQAISGSVAGSKDSVLSGLRAWVSFHRQYLGRTGDKCIALPRQVVSCGAALCRYAASAVLVRPASMVAAFPSPQNLWQLR
jgi:hypothetical protein